MTEHSSYSERLHAFLDGELDASDTGDLFYVLARNQELQAEMRQLVALRNAFPKPLLQPPAALKENILKATVFRAEPTPEMTAARWTFHRLFGDHGLPMLLAAVAASLLTASLFYFMIAPVTGPATLRDAALRPTLPDTLPVATTNGLSISAVDRGASNGKSGAITARVPEPRVAPSHVDVASNGWHQSVSVQGRGYRGPNRNPIPPDEVERLPLIERVEVKSADTVTVE
jgi:anti-sigma factor RsiW